MKEPSRQMDRQTVGANEGTNESEWPSEGRQIWPRSFCTFKVNRTRKQEVLKAHLPDATEIEYPISLMSREPRGRVHTKYTDTGARAERTCNWK